MLTSTDPRRATVVLKVSDLHCWECASRLELALLCTPGVEDAHVDVSGRASIRSVPENLDVDQLLSALRLEGFEIELAQPEEAGAPA